MRTPLRFRDRLRDAFLSEWNMQGVQGMLSEAFTRGMVPGGEVVQNNLLRTAPAAARDFVRRYYDDDPIAMRGNSIPALNLYAELRRLNLAFFQDRLALARQQSRTIEGGSDITDYALAAFMAEPGNAELNTFPLDQIRENQYPHSQSGTPGLGVGGSASNRRQAEYDSAFPCGEDCRRPADGEFTFGELESQGGGTRELCRSDNNKPVDWRARLEGGARFMRYPKIPLWQQYGERNYEYDIRETLGQAPIELDSQVRRWSMARARAHRGEEYRRFGPTSTETH